MIYFLKTLPLLIRLFQNFKLEIFLKVSPYHYSKLLHHFKSCVFFFFWIVEISTKTSVHIGRRHFLNFSPFLDILLVKNHDTVTQNDSLFVSKIVLVLLVY